MTRSTTRREIVAALPLATLFPLAARAAGADPTMTAITQPDQIQWHSVAGLPPQATETADLFGKTSEPGPYMVLIRWFPGFMSAPHWYETDRLCVVLSGVWRCASGADFAPDSTVPVAAGGFVRRVARTPHYDGALKTDAAPAAIAITGIGPIKMHLCDPSKPAWRAV